MAHDPQSHTSLGRMLADLGNQDLAELGDRYFQALMESLTKKASRKSNTNVLSHIQGYLKNHLSSKEKEKLVEAIEQYRNGIIPLIVPIILLKNHFHTYPNEYIAKQSYLQPYPDNLSLRNTI